MLVDQLILYYRMNPEILTHAYPHETKRMNVIKLPYFLRVDPKSPLADFYHELRLHYFSELSQVMLEHFEQLYKGAPRQFCTWALANHLLNSLDPIYTPKDTMASLAALLQKKLANDYEHAFEVPAVKHLVVQRTGKSIMKQQFVQLHDVHSALTKYMHAMTMATELIVRHAEDLAVHDAISTEFLESYAKMIVLTDTIERFYELVR